jgi:hypothetical protein
MMWVLGVVVLLLMMIPLTAIVLDSEVGRALARRLGSGADAENETRLKRLEKEVQYLSEAVQSLQEESRFIRELLERPKEQGALPPGES